MIEAFLRALAEWASLQSEILAVGLVGSQARSTATPDSDVDLVLIVTDPGLFFLKTDWIERFGDVAALHDEDWGLLRSMRVHYVTGLEVEFGFAPPEWASTDPVDPGTREVVSAGLRCLHDPEKRLHRLAAAVRAL